MASEAVPLVGSSEEDIVDFLDNFWEVQIVPLSACLLVLCICKLGYFCVVEVQAGVGIVIVILQELKLIIGEVVRGVATGA